MTHTTALAEWASGLVYDDLPEDIRRLARVALLDTIGVMLAGHAFLESERDDRLARYLDTVAGPEQATALGFHRRGPWNAAAFANGALVEVLDWQDTTMSARLHSCSGTIPAVLAMAEWRELSGRDAALAIAVGYEVGARVGVAMQPSHWYGGFQATGTIGSIGAAAAAGSLFGFGAERMRAVLGVAGFILPISNGDGVFHGFSVKPLHGGMAAQAGVQAALLARSGYDAGPLEGLPPRYHGFMNISGAVVDPAVMSDGLGEDWRARGCSQKAYPVGLLNIGPVQVTLGMADEHDIRPDQVEAIAVTSYSDTLHFTGRHYTDTSSSFSDCVLSLPYTVAAAISDRTFGPYQLTRRRIGDPAVHELAARVAVSVDEEMDLPYPNEWPVAVEIRLKDGRSFSERLDRVIGCPARPMTDEEIASKFLGNTEPILGAANARRVLDACMGLEGVENVAGLVEMLEPRASS